MVIDSKEEYVASCGDDGRVTIFGLCESTHDQIVEFNRPIKSVELEPDNFSRTFSFVTGDTKVIYNLKAMINLFPYLIIFKFKLVLNERGFMGRRKTNILHEGEGIIRNIKWSNDLIAWSNDRVI